MATDTGVETTDENSAGLVFGIVSGTFSVVVLLTAIAYTVILSVVDWAAVDLLLYPAQGVAPFAVISAAILTIAIIVPTALVTVNKTA